MTSKRLVVLVAAAALGIAGCGGGGDTRSSVPSDDPRPGAGLRSEWPATDFDKASVELSEIVSGGPPKDGIPAIDKPVSIGVGEASGIGDREPVIAVQIEDVVRAYPIQILIWHEIVNDTLAGRPIAVTFCPLCNTAIVFDRRVGGNTLDFGTTGRLRQSDLVMYDRQTQSWWQQFSGEAIVGELTGAELTQVPTRVVAWGEFKASYPAASVLSRQTGHDRDYGRNPYSGYDDIDSPPIFPTRNENDDRLEPKERVVFIERGTDAVAIPFAVLRQKGRMVVRVGEARLSVRWSAGVASSLDSDRVEAGRDVGAAQVVDERGDAVAFHEPFWFAVAAFRPEVRIIR